MERLAGLGWSLFPLRWNPIQHAGAANIYRTDFNEDYALRIRLYEKYS